MLATFRFRLPPLSRAPFHRGVVRVRFQVILAARAAVEMDDLLFGFTDFGHDFNPRHASRLIF